MVSRSNTISIHKTSPFVKDFPEYPWLYGINMLELYRTWRKFCNLKIYSIGSESAQNRKNPSRGERNE